MADKGTGIAGAMDHAPVKSALACIVCGAEIHGGMKGKPQARIALGIGIIHACSAECAQTPPFAKEDT